MKRFFNIIKTLIFGIFPTIAGGAIVVDIIYIVKNIQKITETSGWPVVYYFLVATAELIIVVMLWYELGIMASNSKQWIKHKHETAAYNIDSTSPDCPDCEETDEAADR